MNIHPRPDQEMALKQAIKAGIITNGNDALDIALEVLRSRLSQTFAFSSRKLTDVFNPVRSDDLDFGRNPLLGRHV